MTYPDRDAPTTQTSVDPPSTQARPSGSTAGPSAGSNPGSRSSSTTDAVKDQAREAKDTAGQAASDLTSTAKEQAGSVVSEAQEQSKRLLRDAQHELTSQASTQQQRAAGGLRSLGDELRSMADKSEADGPATSLAQQAGDKAASLADWLENKEPGDVLNEVKRFARKRPGAFLALSAGAGLVAARFARGLSGDPSSTNGGSPTGDSGAGKAPLAPARVGNVPRTPVRGEPALATPPSRDIDAGLTTSAVDAPYPPSPGLPPVPGEGTIGDGRGVR